MKLFIIAFAFVIALCRVEAFEEPAPFVLLDPGFLQSTSWSHQISYHSLQDEIDSSFVEINKIVADALAKVTPPSISNYASFAQNVLQEYNPVFEALSGLSASRCKDTLTGIVQLSVEHSGVISGNCYSDFRRFAQAEADSAAAVLNEFSGQYGQVVLNVYKSYAGRNAMVDSEIIEHHINTTYADIAANWVNIQPAIDALRVSLNDNLEALGTKLTLCFTDAFDYAHLMLTVNNNQIQSCIDADRSSRSGRATQIGFTDYTEEAKEITTNWPKFNW